MDVQHYEVHLQVTPPSSYLQGRATLTLHVADTLAALDLDFGPMTVDTVRLDGRAVAAERRRGGLTVPGPVAPGAHEVAVQYRGRPSSGVYVASVAGAPVLFTDSWPRRGRGWLPGVHHPADPATLHLTLDAPLGREVVASGQRQGIDTLAATTRSTWTLGEAVPTYAFAFAVGAFERSVDTTRTGVSLAAYSLFPQRSLAPFLPDVERAMTSLSDLLGPYPFASFSAAQVPIRYAGMENATVAFVQPDLHEREVRTVLVHELAHQWFGNRVVIAGWEDLWLSEGTATYLATLVVERTEGPEAARARRVEMARLTPARRRSLTPLVRRGAERPEDHLTWVVYEKGASVLHLLRRTVGDSTFAAILRETYQRYAGRPLSTQAFQDVAESIHGEDLSAWFAYWVYGDDLPILRTRWDEARRTLHWSIEGDGGTLEGVSFALRIQQDGKVYDVPADAGEMVLPGTMRPGVQPVGVMMDVR